MTTERTTAAINEVRRLNLARSGRFAPRFWPTMVRTAAWKTKPGCRATKVTRLPIPQAAKARGPKAESILRATRSAPRSRTFWAETGQASEANNLTHSTRGRKWRNRKASRERPVKIKKNITANPVILPNPTANPTPANSKRGTAPAPKMKSGMHRKVTIVAAAVPMKAYLASPAPRRRCAINAPASMKT